MNNLVGIGQQQNVRNPRAALANEARSVRAGHNRQPVDAATFNHLKQQYPQVMNLPQPQAPRQSSHIFPTHWEPVMNRHATAPLAIICAQWWLRAGMKKILPLMRSVETGSEFVDAIFKYNQYSFVAEASRMLNEPLLKQWQEKSFQNYFTQIEQATVADPRIWSIQSHRQERVAAISAQGLREISEATNFVYNLVSNSSAIVSTMSTTSLSMSSVSATTVGGPVLGLAVLLATQHMWQAKLNEEEVKAEQHYRALQMRMNDNVQIGNSYNHQIWRDQLAVAERKYTKAWRMRAGTQKLTEAVLTYANTYFLTFDKRSQLNGLGDLKPRDGEPDMRAQHTQDVIDFNDVSHRVTELVKDVSSYQKHSTHLQNLQKTAQRVPQQEWESRASEMLSRVNDIRVVGPQGHLPTIRLLQAPTQYLRNPGRWTITAENGTGKSVLLNALMGRLRTDYHYEPVKHDLSYRWPGGSAGENAIEHIAEVIEGVSASTIFLDEWSANLSRYNENRLDAVLDQLAQNVCIVEVRH